MATVEDFREFVSERLAAAAEEIFGVFRKTVVEFEKEIERQRVMLDVAWKPEVKLHRIEPSVLTREEPDTHHQRSDTENISSLDRDEPEHPQIKVEPEEICSSLGGDHFVPKQEDEAIHSNQPCDVTEASPLVLSSKASKAKEHYQNSQNILSESNSKALTCEVCGETFAFKSHLTGHLKMHPDAKLFTCSVCGKRFRYESSLPRHIRIHTGYKPYSCNTCGKRFSDNSQYHVHIRIHTGEKPYSCGICEKKYPSSTQLKIHMRKHTGERPYSCSSCGMRFTHLGIVKNHMKKHICERPHACRISGRIASNRVPLKRRVKTHTGEEPHSSEAVCRNPQIQNESPPDKPRM